MDEARRGFVRNPIAGVNVDAIKAPEVAADPAAVLADASASPSPSVSPSPSEEAKTEENSENRSIAALPPGYPNPDQIMAMALAQQNAANASATHGSSGPTVSEAATNMANGVGALPTISSPTYSGSAGSTSSGTIYGNSSVIASSDLAALTAPILASFADQSNHINGRVCTTDSNCTHQTNIAVHSLRWSIDEGIDKLVGFSIKASSGATPVQFDVNFKIQDLNLAPQTVSFSSVPSEILAHSEMRNGKNYKVYEFKLPDAQIRNQDLLTSIEATLAYEVTANGLVLSPDSKLTFVRNQVRIRSANWDSLQPNPPLNAGEIYIITDELPYSMNLQKSP